MKSSANKQENNGTKENGKSKKLNYFLIFLVCWLVLVTGFIAWFLLRFNDFAAKYEEQYQCIEHGDVARLLEVVAAVEAQIQREAYHEY